MANYSEDMLLKRNKKSFGYIFRRYKKSYVDNYYKDRCKLCVISNRCYILFPSSKIRSDCNRWCTKFDNLVYYYIPKCYVG